MQDEGVLTGQTDQSWDYICVGGGVAQSARVCVSVCAYMYIDNLSLDVRIAPEVPGVFAPHATQ